MPMCANLVAAGHTVTAGDARAEAEQAVLQCGAHWRAQLAEVAADAEILITMLPGGGEVRQVMAGSGVLAAMPSDAVWIDMSSTSPAAGRELAAAAGPRRRCSRCPGRGRRAGRAVWIAAGIRGR